MTTTLDRPPVLFLSHCAPPLADDATWTRELSAWSGTFDKPKDILMVSAHWENAPVTLSATGRNPGLVYDFGGFPQKYYDVTYDAPQAPGLAAEVEKHSTIDRSPKANEISFTLETRAPLRCPS